jgi:stearoyl-CoA desaturase (delta-9 desaturase)
MLIDIVILYGIYYIFATIGVTLGYHRYLAHNQFKCNPFSEVLMLYFGLLCGGQSPLSWVGIHRMHHAYADTPKDPHSPIYKKWYEILFTTWRVKNIPRKFVKDLYKNPRVMFFHKWKNVILVFTYMISFAIEIKFFLYLIFISIFSYIFYGALNLFGHNDDGPCNKWWINLFAPFEGNHNDHHQR